jgi:uncharacterized membrane protein SpoIIM required for sporulation
MKNKKAQIQAWAIILIFIVAIIFFMYLNGSFVGFALKASLSLVPNWFWAIIGIIIFLKLIGGKKK